MGCVIKDFGSCCTPGREFHSANRGFPIVARILIRTTCKPTESLGKVKIAVLNLFPDARFTREEDTVEAEASSLDRLGERIRNQKIRDAARAVLRAGRSGNVARFSLNKQAAYVGAVSFTSEVSPLGDLEIAIEAEDIDGLIDEIAESTTKRPGEALR